jgi:hypothetical protein
MGEYGETLAKLAVSHAITLARRTIGYTIPEDPDDFQLYARWMDKTCAGEDALRQAQQAGVTNTSEK